MELRIERPGEVKNAEPAFKPTGPAPTGIPKDVREHMRLMADLLVLAFQADLTRVVTFPLANDGSNRPYPMHRACPRATTTCRTTSNDAKKQEKIQKINRFHIEQFAYLLGKLKAVKEGDRTLLDKVMIVYGSGIGDGNRHNHDDLPILLAGKGGGTIKGGRHLRFPQGHAADEPVPGDVRPHGLPDEELRRQHGRAVDLS